MNVNSWIILLTTVVLFACVIKAFWIHRLENRIGRMEGRDQARRSLMADEFDLLKKAIEQGDRIEVIRRVGRIRDFVKHGIL